METTFKPNNITKGKRKGTGRGWMSRFSRRKGCKAASKCCAGTLACAKPNQKCTIKSIETNCDEMKDFLFSLGCYEGEPITVLSIISNQYIVVVKDARYSIDKKLASSIAI